MRKEKALLCVEAVILGGPALAFMAMLLPGLIGATMFMLSRYATGQSDTPLHTILAAPFFFAVGAVSMWVLSRLVVATIKGKSFYFGGLFWGACMAGAYGGVYVYQVFNPRTALLTVVPLFILCAHATVIQIREHHEHKL